MRRFARRCRSRRLSTGTSTVRISVWNPAAFARAIMSDRMPLSFGM
jgi:hypothetical protein